MAPRLAVVVVHFEAPDWCRQTIESLVASSEISVRVILVHNGGELPMLPEGVEVLTPSRNRGYSGGANAGLHRWLHTTEDEWVGLASHDVIVEPDALVRLVALGSSSDDIGIVGPSMSEGVKEGGGTEPVDTKWMSGSLMLIRRSCLLEVGRFDERFASYVEDLEFGVRAREAGWRVVAQPSIHATHRGSASSSAPALTSANHALYDILRGAGWAGRARLALLTAASAARCLVSRRHGPYARARWRALVASLQRPRLEWGIPVAGTTDGEPSSQPSIGPER